MKADYKKINEILSQHRGKTNAITSKKISASMGFPMEDTQAVSRKNIHETAEEYNLPLLSCNKGFYIAETQEELDEYNQNIDSRISKMDKKRNLVNENYRRLHNED